jgi:hypothetical protein
MLGYAKDKSKLLPRKDHAGPKGEEYRRSSTLSLTLALDGVGR